LLAAAAALRESFARGGMANDIGPEVLFARQVIAYGKPGDVALALSTSESSSNIVEAPPRPRDDRVRRLRRGPRRRRAARRPRRRDALRAHPEDPGSAATAYHALRALVEIPAT